MLPGSYTLLFMTNLIIYCFMQDMKTTNANIIYFKFSYTCCNTSFAISI